VRRSLALVTLVAALASSAAGQQAAARVEIVSAIDDESLLKMFANLAADSMQGRRIASPGSLRAREYLVREMQRIGVEPLVPGYVVEFQGWAPDVVSTGIRRDGNSISPTPVPLVASTRRIATGSNVLGVVRGTQRPDRYILVSAHYDHIGISGGQLYAGANDNASGVAALLAIADLMVTAKPRNSVIFAFFDGEEYGLTGSGAFTRKSPVPLSEIVANVNVDMIARSKDNTLYFVGEKYQPRLSALATVVGATGVLPIVPGHDGRDSREDFFRRSDQWSFHQRDVPAVLFTATELDDYHTPFDIAAKVNVGFYIRAVSTIADYVRRLDDSLDDYTRKKQ
jgi:hypothetical protein